MKPPCLLLALTLASSSAAAFEMPLTTTQRAQKLVEEGYEQILRGDFLGAIDTCDKALTVRRDWAPAYVCRSEARLWLRDPKSDRDAREAIRHDPLSGDPFRLLGLWEFEAGRYAPAIKQFNQALSLSKLKPEGVTEIYHFRAKARLKTGDLPGALEDVNRGLGVLQGVNGSYGDWSFYSLRAEVRRAMGERAKADADERRVLELIEHRIKRRPLEAPDLIHRRAQSHALLRDFDGAASDYGRLLEYSSADAKIITDHALALTMGGRFEEGAYDLGRVLELGVPRRSAWLMRALALAAAGDSRRAAMAFDTYLSLKPDDAPGDRRNSRASPDEDPGSMGEASAADGFVPPGAEDLAGRQALLHEMLGRHEKALRLSARALERNGGDLPAHLARATAGLLTWRCAEAAASLDWLADHHPQSAFYLWMRGECRERLGDHRGALTDLSQAVEELPEAKAPLGSLTTTHRRWLDLSGAKAPAEELKGLLSAYDRLTAMRDLEAEERLGRAKTLFDLAQQSKARQRKRLLAEAAGELDEALRLAPDLSDARALRLRIGKRPSTVPRRR